MSAYPPIATAERTCLDVCLVPTAVIRSPRRRGRAVRGHIQAKRFRCLEIDDQFDLSGLVDGQVSRLLAVENAAGIYASLTISLRGAPCVAHKTTGRGECARLKDCRQPVSKDQRGELFFTRDDEYIASDYEPTDTQLNQGGEGRINIAFGTDIQDVQVGALMYSAASCRLSR